MGQVFGDNPSTCSHFPDNERNYYSIIIIYYSIIIMKKMMTLAAALSCAMTMMAEPVSPTVARQAAAKFLQAKGTSLKSEAMRAKSRAMGHVDSGEQTEASPYYVFNAAASQGFVVISGDDCVGDNLVMGYTSQGSFDTKATPDNLQWWLDETATQISTLSRLGIKTRTVALHSDIAPMITAKWDQRQPYNVFCPVTDNQYSLTGCMATALAQVMYYHRWPKEPIAYEMPAYKMGNGRVIEGLPVTSFDWDNMVDVYTESTTEVQQAAVATLMRYCGQLIQMNYTPQLSSGIYYDIDLLTGNFGYASGLYSALADEYTVGGWDELLYNELREGRPLVYCGQSTGGGHAFVLDGYEVKDGEGYYSVNWGWSGEGNGFYRINLLNPDMSGSGGSSTKDSYSCEQIVLIGLQPRKEALAEYHRYLNSGRWNVQEEGVEHEFVMLNPSYRSGSFNIGLAERNEDGTPDLSRMCTTSEYDVSAYSCASFVDSTFTGLLKLPLTTDLFSILSSGRHKLVFVNRESGTSAPWQPVFGPNCYIEVNVGETGEVTETIVHPQLQLAASDSDIKIEGLKQWGILQTVTATIRNTGTEDYIGGVECGVYYVEDGELKQQIGACRTGIMVEGGSSSDVFFSISVPKAGTYVFILTKYEEGKDITGSKLADIKQAQGYLAHNTATFDELNFGCQALQYAERNDDKGNPACFFDIAVDNGTPMDYNAALVAKVYKRNAQGTYDVYEFPNTPYLYTILQLGSNQHKTASIPLPETLEPGEYWIDLFIANDFHSLMGDDYFVFASEQITVTSTSGIEEMIVKGTGNDAWYDMNGRLLSRRPTAKGIYISKGKKQIIK